MRNAHAVSTYGGTCALRSGEKEQEHLTQAGAREAARKDCTHEGF